MKRASSADPWRSAEDGKFLLWIVLWSVDRLRPLLAVFGVDHPTFRELLRVRLLLDLRPRTAGPSFWGVAGLALTVLMTAFAGLGTGVMAVVTKEAAAWVVLSQSALFFLLAYALFAQFAGTLVDPTDIGVVAPHPVSDRTLLAVRLAEVFAQLLLFVVSFTAGNVCVAVFGKPPLAVLLVFPVLSLLCGLTSLGLVALLFALCLRLFGPTRFQRVTLWAQILGGLVLFTCFQLPRFVPEESWQLVADRLHGLRFLWPPYLYAELFDLACGERGGAVLAASLAAVLLPLAALALTFWLASRYFAAGLQGTLGSPSGSQARWKPGLVARLADRLVRPGEERVGCHLALPLSRREPHFLRAVLPQLLMFQVMYLGARFGRHGSAEFYIPLSAGFLFMALPNVLLQGQGTPAPEASWVFLCSPLANEAAVLRGGLKGLLLQWLGLPALLVFCLQLSVAGLAAWPRILLAFEMTFVAALVFARFFRLGIPFTQPIRGRKAGAENFGLVLAMGLGLGVLVAVHAALVLQPIVLGTSVVVFAGLVVFLWRKLDRVRVAADRRIGPG